MAVYLSTEPVYNRSSINAVKGMREKEVPKAVRENAWVKDWCKLMTEWGVNIDRVVNGLHK